jgi:phage terminase large subunit
MLNKDIVKEMYRLEVNQNITIWADSAEPKTIEEIRRNGFNIKPVSKGSDSINFGISILQEFQILVTQNSINAIKELRNYTWDKDKTGNKINKPVDAYNHLIDAFRYFAMMELKKKSTGWVIG